MQQPFFKRKTLLFSIITGALLYLLMWLVVQQEAHAAPPPPINPPSFFSSFLKGFSDNLKHPLAILVLQLIVIVFVTRFFGVLCKKIRQPSVIGQVIAGIVLGPSLLGLLFPAFSAFLFSPESLKTLKLFSDLGLIFFMFIVGMELDINVLKDKARQAVVISYVGIIIPFILGIAVSFFLYKSFAPATVSFLAFALFIGIAMSITAFPVLARIVQERGITKTHVGTIALTCAAVDDVTAWCVLAIIIAIATAGSVYASLLTIALALIYVVFMLKILRPLLHKYSESYLLKENLHKTLVGVLFVIMLASSYITETIGLHALFGAFMAGIIMPHNISFKKNFAEKIEDVSLVLLLPVFFAFSGLRTQIGLLNQANEWWACLIVILVAVAGKFGGCFLAAKFVGEKWKDSLSIGVLMNTRGLMELIVLNIGYDLGVLNVEMFSILVLMALVTTFLTNPSLDLIDKIFKKRGISSTF